MASCQFDILTPFPHEFWLLYFQISKILHHSSSVTFLNLSFNSLEAAVAAEKTLHFPLLPRLSTLILIGTKLSWESIWFLLRKTTTLTEIHLSLNDFERVETLNQNYSSEYRAPQIKDGEESPCGSLSSDSGHGSSSDDEDGHTFPHLRRLVGIWESRS